MKAGMSSVRENKTRNHILTLINIKRTTREANKEIEIESIKSMTKGPNSPEGTVTARKYYVTRDRCKPP